MSDLLELPAGDLLAGPTAHRTFAEAFATRGHGRALVTFDDPTAHRRNQDRALALLSSLGTVLAVYPHLGPWSDLSVRTDADPGRTHGIGENKLHIDMVERDLTPRIIALYCVRDDPAGGGASALADMWAAVDSLASADREILKCRAYSYWADEGVHGVGESLERFPIVPEHLEWGFPVRFTSKMGPHLDKAELIDTTLLSADQAAGAFGRLVAAVYAQRTTVRLRPGQLLIWDQQRYAHGRMPLGDGQGDIADGERRLLQQAYVGEAGTR
ncbi:TauD/TfdA family dioxygenase [Kitasatospora aureofaciens]|uniref:TauD/TfdA family dioxygenase n=1 Tax=Kitasatospora aureofaciens TaxID=1894 RepID=UPI001C454C28|nr:TauD/TfdA family dioxygenase [Kitasatospora aureofaciens]MBV6702765.1 TauD/TfdA family dioxygenase [Kitasatospora aureofaciens]